MLSMSHSLNGNGAANSLKGLSQANGQAHSFSGQTRFLQAQSQPNGGQTHSPNGQASANEQAQSFSGQVCFLNAQSQPGYPAQSCNGQVQSNEQSLSFSGQPQSNSQAHSFNGQTHSSKGQAQFSNSFSQHQLRSTPTASRRAGTPQPSALKFVEALDHLSTKLKIPVTAVEPTNALQDDGLVPGICRLFMEGRCRQGTRCFQVHANRDIIEALRKEALEVPSCCHLHGASCNYEGLPFNLTVTLNGRSIGLHSLNPTNYLWSIYGEHGENNLTVSKGRICREHRKGLCRFGDECGFLHICREIPIDGEEYISATPVSIPRVKANGKGTEGNWTANGCNYNNNNNGEEVLNAHSLNASSFNAASFNGTNTNGFPNGLHVPGGNEPGAMGSLLGGESGSLSSVNRSRQSFSYRMKHASYSEGEKSIKGPLLRPLRAPQRGSFSQQQRHNPYADASSFQ